MTGNFLVQVTIDRNTELRKRLDRLRNNGDEQATYDVY